MADNSQYEIEITSSGTAAELRLERATIEERLGTLFEINLSLYSEDQEIDLAGMLGENLTIHVSTTKEERWFHGIVCHFSAVGFSKRYGHYQAVVRPRLWLLGQNAECRVFESMNLTEIVKKSLDRHRVDVGSAASSSVTFEHCVQYRESDLHFVSRLLERHGMYYFFDHTDKKHTVEIAASMSDHSDVGEFDYDAEGSAGDEYQIEDWRATTNLRSSSYKVTGTKNLTRSSTDANHKTRFSIKGAKPLEIHDFEAVDEEAEPRLKELAQARMQAIDATVEEFTGTTRSTKIRAGALFTLAKHPRSDQNRQYLVVGAIYQLEGDLPDGGGKSENPFSVAFSAIDAKTPFSPPVAHEKPTVQGPHLATVVEETDEYGRVTVKFQWGAADGELQSCRARVSQNWAGQEWGGVFLPHIGHEVIVEFLDGDPDQPMVTGRVYNKESMPPLSLPGDKQKSIIRDHGGNEIMLDGTDGAQQMHLWCPSHESEIWLGRSIELKSTSDFKNFFTGNWNAEIGGDRDTQVNGSESKTIAQNVQENILGKFNCKVGGDFVQVRLGIFNEFIGGMTSKHIGGAKHERIIGAEMKKIGGIKSETHNGAYIKKGDNKKAEDYPDAISKTKDVYVQKAKNFVTEVGEVITQKCQDLKIGAKLYAQDVEDFKVKVDKEARWQAKLFKMKLDTAYEMEAKKLKNKIVGTAMWAAVKFSVNDGNLEVKK
ncbi:MAG: type VI secretion system tip protein VgrG [bacterium]|nr:type VI secretion system tip protein VgrG [bacterium]